MIHPELNLIKYIASDHGDVEDWHLNAGEIKSIEISDDKIIVSFIVGDFELEGGVIELLDADNRLIVYEKVNFDNTGIYVGKFGLCTTIL